MTTEFIDLMFGRSTELAVELADVGARFVVSGSTGRRLCGADCRPRDLDVLVAHDDLAGFADALGLVQRSSRPLRLQAGTITSVRTGWCRLDVFARSALPPSKDVEVRGRRLAVVCDD